MIARIQELNSDLVEEFTMEEMRIRLAQAESKNVVSADVVIDDVVDLFKTSDDIQGITLPWKKSHDNFRFRPKEITLVAGVNGHKKTTVMSQAMLHVANQVPVGIMSFEMPLEKTVQMLVQQAYCKAAGDVDMVKRFVNWSQGRMWFYRALGTVKTERVFGCLFAMASLGCKVILIDNLQKCGVSTDPEKERDFMADLTSCASALGISIVLVHHIRKPDRMTENWRPNRFDVRGSGSLTDQAHNVVIVFHNKNRAAVLQKQESGQALYPEEREILRDFCDIEFIVEKQRDWGFEDTIELYEGNGRSLKDFAESPDLRLEGL